jgi:hypothetical protein
MSYCSDVEDVEHDKKVGQLRRSFWLVSPLELIE